MENVWTLPNKTILSECRPNWIFFSRKIKRCIFRKYKARRGLSIDCDVVVFFFLGQVIFSHLNVLKLLFRHVTISTSPYVIYVIRLYRLLLNDYVHLNISSGYAIET